MSEMDAKPEFQTIASATMAPADVSAIQIFLEFLLIGATSFGGVPSKPGWQTTLDQRQGICRDAFHQPKSSWTERDQHGSLFGNKLRGAAGSIAGIFGMCLPGAVLMLIVGIVYRAHGDHVWITAALKGVAAAAVGRILATVLGLSKESLSGRFDFVFMALTVIAVNRFHLSVPRTLVAVGSLAILFHRPRNGQNRSVAP